MFFQAEGSSLIHIDPEQRKIAYNPKFEELYAPQVGPANVFKPETQKMTKNTFTGKAHTKQQMNKAKRQSKQTHTFLPSFPIKAIAPTIVCGSFP